MKLSESEERAIGGLLIYTHKETQLLGKRSCRDESGYTKWLTYSKIHWIRYTEWHGRRLIKLLMAQAEKKNCLYVTVT